MTRRNIFFILNVFPILIICLLQANVSSALATQNCTVNGLIHNYLAITDPLHDTDTETRLPYTYHLRTENVTSAYVSTWNARISLDENKNLFITVPKVNEKDIQSQGTGYHVKFVLFLRCTDGSIVPMNTVVPFVDSNNHQPFFSKPKYIYNLISTYEEDFKRQLYLNPITATDYDVTNQELLFNIEDNKYFDIVYGGVVPGTLKKRHFAQLVLKFPGTIITKKLEVSLKVTDMGNPPNSNTTKLVINPPSPPIPTFVKPFYVGHLYKNGTFKMSENPQLEEGTTYYDTEVLGCFPYETKIYNEEVRITYNRYNGVSRFYERNYVTCILRATYTDPKTNLLSSGKTVLIVEYHHDL